MILSLILGKGHILEKYLIVVKKNLIILYQVGFLAIHDKR